MRIYVYAFMFLLTTFTNLLLLCCYDFNITQGTPAGLHLWWKPTLKKHVFKLQKKISQHTIDCMVSTRTLFKLAECIFKRRSSNIHEVAGINYEGGLAGLYAVRLLS